MKWMEAILANDEASTDQELVRPVGGEIAMDRIQVIWDREHGSALEGWFVRLNSLDMVSPYDAPLPRDASDEELVEMARETLDWSGLTRMEDVPVEVVR